MRSPDRYIQMRESLPDDALSYGCGGIKLFSAAELDIGQVGYSVAPDGSSLCSSETGAWQSNWVVIGYEIACGDPLFIDVDAAPLPVFTAIHGEGAWKSLPVAASVDAFAKCIEEFSCLSVVRRNPVEREANPLSDDERMVFLRRVAKLNQTSSAPDFWHGLLKC